jgi:uncharacterized protein YndB with AHSA1/START domain
MTAPSVTLVRRIRAAPARLYAAWTDPALIARWWAPSSVQVLDVEAAGQVGGAWRVRMLGGDGVEYIVGGVYLELQPPTRLAFTWGLRPGTEPPSNVTVELRALGAETELTLTHEAHDRTREGRADGWTRSLFRLAREFEDPGPVG